VSCTIEFCDDGVNAIPQFEQLPKRALLVGDHPVNASPKFLLSQRAGAECLLDHPAKVAAISLGLKAKLASPRQLWQLGDVNSDLRRPLSLRLYGPIMPRSALEIGRTFRVYPKPPPNDYAVRTWISTAATATLCATRSAVPMTRCYVGAVTATRRTCSLLMPTIQPRAAVLAAGILAGIPPSGDAWFTSDTIAVGAKSLPWRGQPEVEL
jgi:hypothetical protein